MSFESDVGAFVPFVPFELFDLSPFEFFVPFSLFVPLEPFVDVTSVEPLVFELFVPGYSAR